MKIYGGFCFLVLFFFISLQLSNYSKRTYDRGYIQYRENQQTICNTTA